MQSKLDTDPYRVYLLSDFRTHTSNSTAKHNKTCSKCGDIFENATCIQIANTACCFAFCRKCAPAAIDAHFEGTLMRLSRFAERSDIQQLPLRKNLRAPKQVDPNQEALF